MSKAAWGGRELVWYSKWDETDLVGHHFNSLPPLYSTTINTHIHSCLHMHTCTHILSLYIYIWYSFHTLFKINAVSDHCITNLVTLLLFSKLFIIYLFCCCCCCCFLTWISVWILHIMFFLVTITFWDALE